MRLGEPEGAPSPFFSSDEADYILECSEGTEGRTVDASEENGEGDNDDASGRTEGRGTHKLQQRGNELQIQHSPGDGWGNHVTEIEKQNRDQRKKHNRHAHAKRLETVKPHGVTA